MSRPERHGKAGDLRSDRIHYSGDLPTRHVGKRRLYLIAALDKQAVREAEGSRAHADAHLSARRLGHRPRG